MEFLKIASNELQNYKNDNSFKCKIYLSTCFLEISSKIYAVHLYSTLVAEFPRYINGLDSRKDEHVKWEKKIIHFLAINVIFGLGSSL